MPGLYDAGPYAPDVLGAAVWGMVAGTSFVLGGLLALHRPLPGRWVGLVLGLGAGALLSAVAYELVEEAGALSAGSGRAALGLTAGAVVSYVVGGHSRGPVDTTVPSNRLLGAAALDVSCEAIIIVGSLLAGHGISAAVIVAVFLCGAPSAYAWTEQLRERGLLARPITLLWLALLVLCGLVAFAVHALLDGGSDGLAAFVLAFAAGSLFVTVLAELLPTARNLAGAASSLAGVAGFGLSFGLIELT